MGMAQSHVLAGLIAKRAELAGQVENAQDTLRELVIALNHVDAAIHIFDPSIELMEIRARPVPPRHQAFKGEITRIVFDALRKSDKPLRTFEVAEQVMIERGLNAGNRGLSKTMSKRTGACLRHWEIRGEITRLQGPGQYALWELKRT